MGDQAVKKQLPPELLSLVHHLELTQSGWWDKALQQLALMVLWLKGDFMTAAQIRTSIEDNYSVVVDLERLTSQLGTLLHAKALVNTGLNRYKIAEERARSLEQELQAGRRVEEQARQLFIDRISALDVDVDPHDCWYRFQSLCLIPLVRHMGARTYDFITSGRQPRNMIFEYTEQFFKAYDAVQQETLRQTIVEYLAPSNNAVREFVLRLLDNAFFIEASGLPKEALASLSDSAGKKISLKLFFDTNLLFSILDLHDNRSNDSAQALLHLLSQISDAFPSSLYVLPLTVEEFRSTLTHYQDRLANISCAPNIATASRLYGKLSGLTLRYMRACEEAGRSISAVAFFKPYITNTVRIMREKGLDLFNASCDTYFQRQDVVDDINAFWQGLDAKQHSNRRYKAIEHDMVLRHLVNDRRPPYVESPLDAQYWVATVDFRLIRFDQDKAAAGRRPPVCIDPVSLVRMLQLWLPRTDALERAMLEGFKIPFGFSGFDAESETVTLKILETLSRFEDVSDLSTETITHLLIDDVTRQRMRTANHPEEEARVVRETLGITESNLRADFDELLNAKEEQELRAAKQSRQIDILNRERGEQDKSLIHLTEQLELRERKRLTAEDSRDVLRRQLYESEAEVTIGKETLRYLVRWLMLPIVASLVIVFGVTIATLSLGVSGAPMIVGTAFFLGIAAALGISDWRGRGVAGLENVGLYRWVQRMRNWLYPIIGTIVISMIGRIIWGYLGSLGPQ